MTDHQTSLFDKILNKLASRKLVTFALASFFLSQGTLTADNWTLIACIYIGAQGAIDFYQVSKGMRPQEPE